jgi:catechol 2,3-dioxygenase-like lactoylglutathione lyase family enzyme
MTEFTYDHVHLRSPNPDETAAYYERMFGAEIVKSVMSNELKAKGAEFTVEPKTIRPGVRIAFVRGPQNVLIEILDRDV